MNLSIGQVAANLSEGGKFLDYGVHDVVFKGISKGTVGKDNEYATLAVKLDVAGYGEYIYNLFEPQSSERTPGMYGENPSPTEQFMTALICILKKANPEVAANPVSISGPTFNDMIKQMAEATASFVGQTTQAKFLPGRNGFAGLPSYPATINQNGTLILNKFFGDDLVLSARDIKAIDKAKAARASARPTDMSQRVAVSSDVLDSMAYDDSEDLPF